MSDHLVSLIEAAGHPRVLVVGDLVLDRYVWGEVARISPEGPIPVLRLTSDEARPGGAGNVVNNLVALGARVQMVSVIGDDANGALLKDEMRQ